MRTPPILALVLLPLVGCVSSPEAIPTHRTQPVRTVIESGEGLIRVEVEQSLQTEAISTVVAAPAEALWPRVGEAYRELGLEVNTVDTERRLLAAVDQRVRRLGGRRVSAYLDCGSGVNGIYADVYEVRLSVATQLLAVEGGTEVRTRVVGSARDPGHSNNALRCVTKRRLEESIAEALRPS